MGKVLKGDPKDNIKKSHTQIKIKTEDLTIVKDRVYANLVDYVKRYPKLVRRICHYGGLCGKN